MREDGIRDTRLIERAIRQRWDIPEDKRKKAIARQMAIACGEVDDASPREEISAFKSILMMEAQNQKDEHKVIDVHVSARIHRLDELAADLGIEVGAIENAARSTGGGDCGAEAEGGERVDD